jgi:hypothetical protein
VIKKRRLQWADHAWRSQNELIKAVMEQNPHGKRPLGRPKSRWEDLDEKNVRSLGEEQIGNKEQWIEKDGEVVVRWDDLEKPF